MKINISKKILLYLIFSILFLPINSFGDEQKIIMNLEGLKKSKPYNCDNLVDVIHKDSRRYLDRDGYSIEQILSRVTLNDTDTLIKCSGMALLSNGSKQNINYESYKDSQNDWIIKYSLIR